MKKILGPLALHHLEAAGQLLLDSNEGKSPAELVRSLLDCHRRWPSLQVGSVGPAGELLGLVAGRVDEDDRELGWSDDTVVLPAMRGSGLGGELIEAQLSAMRALGCKRVRGLSPQSKFRAVKFFERHGFRVVERTIAKGWWGITDGQQLWITQRDL